MSSFLSVGQYYSTRQVIHRKSNRKEVRDAGNSAMPTYWARKEHKPTAGQTNNRRVVKTKDRNGKGKWSGREEDRNEKVKSIRA